MAKWLANIKLNWMLSMAKPTPCLFKFLLRGEQGCQCYILSPSMVCPPPSSPSVKSLKIQGLRLALMQPDVLNWFYEPFLCFKQTFIFVGNCMSLIFQIKSFGMRFQHLCLGEWFPSNCIRMKIPSRVLRNGIPTADGRNCPLSIISQPVSLLIITIPCPNKG